MHFSVLVSLVFAKVLVAPTDTLVVCIVIIVYVFMLYVCSEFSVFAGGPPEGGVVSVAAHPWVGGSGKISAPVVNVYFSNGIRQPVAYPQALEIREDNGSVSTPSALYRAARIAKDGSEAY